MRISATIDYWGEGVTTFDPEKVLTRLESWFPQIIIDSTDYGQAEVERITLFAKSNFPENRYLEMSRQIQEKNRRNGPVFQFSIELEGGEKINGYAKRYEVAFNSENEINNSIKQTIYQFLKTLSNAEIIIE